jgi:DNA helicase HerA-like ATPase
MNSAAMTDLFLGAGATPARLALRYANRHGLIAGATGTGKTVSLQIMAEGFSAAGVPVFMADVKGDLAGLAQAGESKPFLLERAQKIGLADYAFNGFPVTFWDLYGEAGHPVRTTVSEMGPLLLSRMLGLNEVQEGVLTLAFKVADDEGLLVLDMKDLRSLLTFVAEQADKLTVSYGNVSAASIGAIQRRLLELEAQGAERFFGEPALELHDFMRTAPDGRGMINILAAHRLIEAPKLYATFLLWLLSELFEELPEVGDQDRPRLVFFFDEAHLLFSDAPKALIDKVTQVVRLIRSKGVGVYFVTQNPLDVPDAVLGQLGNRIQHALRAYTPRDQKAVRAAAQTFRPNPSINTEQAITELSVGEALVSTLGEKGVPTLVERVFIRPPSSRMGTLTPQERQAVMSASPLAHKYDKTIDRHSAYEMLQDRAKRNTREVAADSKEQTKRSPKESAAKPKKQAARRSDSAVEAGIKSVVRSIGSTLGRELVRGILGSLRR